MKIKKFFYLMEKATYYFLSIINKIKFIAIFLTFFNLKFNLKNWFNVVTVEPLLWTSLVMHPSLVEKQERRKTEVYWE